MKGWTVLAAPPALGLADAAEARRALAAFADPAAGCELLGLPTGRTLRRPGGDQGALEEAAEALAAMPSARGVYWGLNPVRPDLDHPMTVADVSARRWLLVDVDPVRPKDANATDGEHEAARLAAAACFDDLCAWGWPSPVMVDSGNGWQLLYRVDLPADRASQVLVKLALAALAKLYDTDAVKVDLAPSSAKAHAKLPGSWVRKGPHSDERPHRVCRLVHLPETVEVVSAALLAELAGPAPKPPERQSFVLRVPGRGTAAYARAALEREVARVRFAQSGAAEGRNNALFKASANLYELVAGGVFSDGEVFRALEAAAAEVGLPAGEARATIASGKKHGLERPRGVPEDNGYHAPTAGPAIVTRKRPDIYRMSDLIELDLPPPRWVVPGLLSEGLTILAGKPKLGKSWMALNMALTVAAGGMVLGEIQSVPGDVLYLSLEDRLRRVQDRARKLLKGTGLAVSRRLHIAVEWPRQNDGGLEEIERWAKEQENPALVIVDVWQKFRPPQRVQGGMYEQDYGAISLAKGLLDDCGIAAGMVVHHCKKASAEDALEEVSGTNGLAGAADGVLVLARARNENEGTLMVTGRDVEEKKLAVEFDPKTFVWKLLGDAEARLQSQVGRKILDMLRGAGPNVFFWPREVAEQLNLDPGSCRRILCRLIDRGLVRRKGGRYAWPADGIGAPAEEDDDARF